MIVGFQLLLVENEVKEGNLTIQFSTKYYAITLMRGRMRHFDISILTSLCMSRGKI